MLYDLFTSRDFAVNLLAGFAIFSVDVVVIAALVPYLIRRHHHNLWVPSRLALVELMSVKARNIYLSLAHPNDERLDSNRDAEVVKQGTQTFVNNWHNAYTATISELHVYGPAYDAKITALVAKFVASYAELNNAVHQLNMFDLIHDPHFFNIEAATAEFLGNHQILSESVKQARLYVGLPLPNPQDDMADPVETQYLLSERTSHNYGQLLQLIRRTEIPLIEAHRVALRKQLTMSRAPA